MSTTQWETGIVWIRVGLLNDILRFNFDLSAICYSSWLIIYYYVVYIQKLGRQKKRLRIGTSEEKTTNWDVRRKDYVRKDFDNGRMGRQKKGRRQWDVRRKDVDREVGRQKKRLRQWEDGTSEERTLTERYSCGYL